MAATPSVPPEGAQPDPAIDWQAAEESPEFKELVAKQRRFILPATIFFLAWYFGFIALAGYAEDFMGKSVHEGLTVGYVLALTQFVMVWGLGWLYLRKADRDFDPLRERAAARALQVAEAADESRSDTIQAPRHRPGTTSPTRPEVTS